ncbi:MAG: MGMT family protein [Coriobacteriia bacterium]
MSGQGTTESWDAVFHYQTRIGRVSIAEHQGRVAAILFDHDRMPIGAEALVRETPLIAEAHRQLSEYLAGTRKALDLPLELSGTPMRERVWQLVAEVPYAETVTYTDLADRLSRELAKPVAEATVASALAACPVPVAVPVHRAVPASPRPAENPAARIRAFLRALESVVRKREAGTPEGERSREASGEGRDLVRYPEGRPAEDDGPCFPYDGIELAYLREIDPLLATYIDGRGIIDRPCQTDIFSALIGSIIGQQISNKAYATIWRRTLDRFGNPLTAEKLDSATLEEIQSLGMSFRKAEYIKATARAVLTGTLEIDRFDALSDDAIIAELIALPGIGRWTAEMLMVFSLQRRNIVAWDDLALRRGMMRVYGMPTLTRKRFDRLVASYYPCGTVAALYFWAASV